MFMTEKSNIPFFDLNGSNEVCCIVPLYVLFCDSKLVYGIICLVNIWSNGVLNFGGSFTRK